MFYLIFGNESAIENDLCLMQCFEYLHLTCPKGFQKISLLGGHSLIHVAPLMTPTRWHWQPGR